MILFYILLGYFISNLVTLIVLMATDEDEDKTIMTSLGIAWIFVLLIRLFVKITKCYSDESQAKRIEKAAKKLLKKENITDNDWKKFYEKHYGNKCSSVLNIMRQTETNKQLEKRGFYDWRAKYWEEDYQKKYGNNND